MIEVLVAVKAKREINSIITHSWDFFRSYFIGSFVKKCYASHFPRNLMPGKREGDQQDCFGIQNYTPDDCINIL